MEVMFMPIIRNMRVEDVDAVARMVALDHDSEPEKGYSEAKEHTLDHLKIVPQHCFVVEDSDKQIIAAMVLHPREEYLKLKISTLKISSKTKKR